MLNFARRYLIPGAILQSVMIGGGYGTGREVVEYFSNYGTMGGFYSVLIAAVCIAIVFAVSLEISCVFNVFDYRNFFKVFLGRFWFLYEILAILLFLLIIAVIASAAGQVLQAELEIPSFMGTVVMLFSVVVLTFYGRDLVVLVLAYWSVFLYAVFIVYFIAVFSIFQDSFTGQASTTEPGWFTSGLQYAFYNMAGIPLILYAARAIETRQQALIAGIVGGVIAMIPALLLHVSFISQLPSILGAGLPVYEMFIRLDQDWLKIGYLIVLFGTFIETGAGTIQGFVERFDGWWSDRTGDLLSPKIHATIAGAIVALAGILSQVGIIDLIAKGYGTLAWGFMILYIIPLLTVGIWRLYVVDRDSPDG
jgi:uncharacterized membrane protein YkvI|tara:strand:- start:333 stop:1427 length:1095 start_codon:yes stop_codon:yes gene_type:complete